MGLDLTSQLCASVFLWWGRFGFASAVYRFASQIRHSNSACGCYKAHSGTAHSHRLCQCIPRFCTQASWPVRVCEGGVGEGVSRLLDYTQNAAFCVSERDNAPQEHTTSYIHSILWYLSDVKWFSCIEFATFWLHIAFRNQWSYGDKDLPILRFCVDQYCSHNIIPYCLTCMQGKESVSRNVAQGDHSAPANCSAIAMQMHAAMLAWDIYIQQKLFKASSRSSGKCMALLLVGHFIPRPSLVISSSLNDLPTCRQ